jgi:hypothetical protein
LRSLLGTGVTFWSLALLKAGLFADNTGNLGLSLLESDNPGAFGAALGVLAGAALEKNPRMELWFLLETALEPCLFNVGCRAGVVSSVFAMLCADDVSKSLAV